MFFECPSGVNLKCSTECFSIRKGFPFRNYSANLKEPLENNSPLIVYYVVHCVCIFSFKLSMAECQVALKGLLIPSQNEQ